MFYRTRTNIQINNLSEIQVEDGRYQVVWKGKIIPIIMF